MAEKKSNNRNVLSHTNLLVIDEASLLQKHVNYPLHALRWFYTKYWSHRVVGWVTNSSTQTRIVQINFIRNTPQEKSFMKIRLIFMQNASLVEIKSSHFFFTKQWLISSKYCINPRLLVPDALHTADAPEIWLYQSGFSWRENLNCPDVIKCLVTGKHWRQATFLTGEGTKYLWKGIFNSKTTSVVKSE